MMNSTFKLMTLAVVMSFLTLTAAAQVHLSEDFNNGWPAGWTTIDGDGGTYNANLGWVPNSGSWRILEDYDTTGVMDSAAVSSSWYDPIVPADDWMITPQVTLGAAPQISYDEKAQDPAYPDGYELRISTTTPDAAGFNANPAIYTVGAGANPAVRQTFSLATYANQSVYLAWHNNSTDMFTLMIDNVVIDEIPGGEDAAVTAVDAIHTTYTQLPVGLGIGIDLGGTIENTAAGTVTNAQLNADVELVGTGSVYTTSSAGVTLTAGQTSTENLGNFVPVQVGQYVVHYDVTIAETDQNAANDVMMSDTIMVTDSTIAKDDAIITGTLGIGAGTIGWLGNQFTIPASDDLTSITWLIDPNATGTMDGQYTRAQVLDMNGGTPNAVLFETDSMMINGPGPHLITMAAPVTVPTDFVLVVVEPDSNTVLGTTSAIFTLGTGWVDFPGNPFGGWSNNEDFNFNVTYFLRGNFADSTGVGLEDVAMTDEDGIIISAYPNPAVSNVNLNVAFVDQTDFTVEVMNSLGQAVHTESFRNISTMNKTISVDNWAAGVYTINVTTSEVRKTLQFVKQ